MLIYEIHQASDFFSSFFGGEEDTRAFPPSARPSIMIYEYS